MAEAAEPVESDSGITGKSLVVAGALALSLVPGLVGCASLGPVPAPSSVSVSSTMVQAAVVNEDGTHLSEERAAPIKDSQKQAMAEIATGTSEDDGTAQEVRGQYQRHADDALRQSGSFQKAFDRLDAEATRLEEFVAGMGADSAPVNRDGFTISVETQGGRTRVEALSRGITIESVREGDVRTVTLYEGRNQTELVQTPFTVKVTSEGVVRTLHVQAQPEYGFKAGDFEVSREGPRGSRSTLVRGTEIHTQAQETISGYAGNIRRSSREDFTVPDVHIGIGSKVTLDYHSHTESLNEVTGTSTVRTRHVAVFADGHSADKTAEVEGER